MDTFGSPILEDVAFNQDGSLKQSGKQNVKFYHKKVLSFRAKKNENGDLIWDKKTGLPEKEAFEEHVEMLRVETKGDTNIFDDRASEFHKRQFYRQYKYFRDGKIPEGNPIENFDFIQAPVVMELHMLGIHVIEQVADMSDLECQQLKDQPGYEIRDIARQWVKINSPQGQASKAAKLEQEVLKLKRELENMKAPKRSFEAAPQVIDRIVEEPSKEITTMELSMEDAAKGAGRPRKVQ